MKISEIFKQAKKNSCPFCGNRLYYRTSNNSFNCKKHGKYNLAFTSSRRKSKLVNITCDKVWFYIYANGDCGFYDNIHTLEQITILTEIESFEQLEKKIDLYITLK